MKLTTQFILLAIVITACTIHRIQAAANDVKIVNDKLRLQRKNEKWLVKREENANVAKPQKDFGLIIGLAALGVAVASLVHQLATRGVNVVALANRLPDEMTVRCNSADDQIGPVNLKMGDSMAFRFKENLWGTTHFWCTAWDSNHWQAFPVWNEGAPKWSTIVFNLRDDGIYYTDNVDSDRGLKQRDW